jgi:hypothetical protein
LCARCGALCFSCLGAGVRLCNANRCSMAASWGCTGGPRSSCAQ